MDSIEQYVRSMERRITGRVFTHEGRLHLVVGVDRKTGLARLSCRYNRHTEVIDMPISEVVLRLGEACRKHAQALEGDA